MAGIFAVFVSATTPSSSVGRSRRVLAAALFAAVLVGVGPDARGAAAVGLDEIAGQDWLALNFVWPEDVTFAHDVTGRELVIRFASAVPEGFINGLSEDAVQWIDYLSFGFDSILIRMKPGIEADVSQPGPREVAAVFSRREIGSLPENAGDAEPDRADLRFRMLEAELLRKGGQLVQARRLMRQEMDRNPKDIDVLIALAGIESELGRRDKAVQLYNRVLALQPDLEEIAIEKKRLKGIGRSNVVSGTEIRIGSTVQLVKDEDRQEEHRLHARHWLTRSWQFILDGERRKLSTGAALRSNGDIAGFRSIKQRAAVGAKFAVDAGTAVEGVIHLSEGLPGASMRVSRRGFVFSPESESSVEVDIFEPYWGLVEGIVNDGARSRVRTTHYEPLGQEIDLFAESAVNSYRIDNDARVADSVSAGISTTYSPWWLPHGLSLGYQVDAEYVLTRQVSRRSDGTTFRPLNVVTRETHTARIGFDREIADHLSVALNAGYNYDRFNSKGPVVATAIRYAPSPGVQAELTASQSIASSRGSDGTVNRFGALLSWLF